MTASVNNQSLNEILNSHSICGIQCALWKAQILEVFSDYVNETSFKKWHLSLHRFTTTKPLTYFQWQVVKEALAFFNQHPNLTIEGVTKLQRELSHAIFSILRPGVSWAKEEKLSLDRPDQMAEFDSIWHPEYQRYCEHIFNHLVQLPLYVIGSQKGKDYLSPVLPNRVDLVQNNSLAALTAGYDSVVRNAISHGSFTTGHFFK